MSQPPLWCDAVKLFVSSSKEAADKIKCNHLLDVMGSQLEAEAAMDAIDILASHIFDMLPNFTSSVIFDYENVQLRATGLPVTCTASFAEYFKHSSCSCVQFYTEDAQGNCEPPVTGFSLAVVLGGTIGGLFAGILVVFLVQFMRSFKRLKQDLDLNERLLKRSNFELSEFKMSWAIEKDELRMISKLDEGTFGEVWKAEWDGILVAVKRIRAGLLELNESAMQEFSLEVDSICKLRHRNVVRFFGACLTAEIPFLVTEFMERGGLNTYLRDMTINIPWNKRLDIMMDIQSGMHHIHTLGRMHRDLKTANILLTKQLRAKIADFGSMKDMLDMRIIGRNLSKNEQRPEHRFMTTAVGTPLYMSPEVMDRGKYGPSADVWSFGVVLWEVCSRNPPDVDKFDENFPREGPFLSSFLRFLQQGNRLPLTKEICPSPMLAKIISQCWQLSPLARPTFDDLGDIISQVDDLPV
eukprot:m.37028 g.37028  ORF g.37028 m.37028 type:complete len:468 (+) comp9230_c0_seq1:155-1558(+)